MGRATQFERELDRLFEQRTHWLRHVLSKPTRGPAPLLNKHKRERALRRLQDLALEALRVKLARRYFKKSVHSKKSWQVKGRGYAEKRENFDKWFSEYVAHDKCVYVFWAGKRCVYVGRTGIGGGRPSSHFEKVWFAPVRRIVVYAAKGNRKLPAAECLAQHRYQPTRNRYRAAKKKWTAKCPLCVVQRRIKMEVREIFRL